MNVLVTGGTGFTGSHLVKRLLSRGYSVTILDNQKGLVADAFIASGAKVILESVTDKPKLKEVIAGQDVIFHLAAAFRRVNLPKTIYWDTNVDSMRHLLQTAQAEGVQKVVYCSTQGVHGNVNNPPGDENTPIEPEDYYQQTKYEGEKIASEFIAKGMDITILRPTAIYGPGDPARFLMLFKQVKKGYFPFFGKGQALYHPLYIDNFIDAFELAAKNPRSCGETYLVADENYYTIKNIVLMVAKIMNVDLKIYHLPFWPTYMISAVIELLYKPFTVDPPLFRRRMDWFRQNRAFRIDKARRELDYSPSVTLEDGLQRTYKWYRKNGYL